MKIISLTHSIRMILVLEINNKRGAYTSPDPWSEEWLVLPEEVEELEGDVVICWGGELREFITPTQTRGI